MNFLFLRSSHYLLFFTLLLTILLSSLSAAALTKLGNFGVNVGASPEARLLQANDGNFYGTTFYGGENNDGTVFRLTPAGTLTTLVNFAGANGANPACSLIQDNEGNF